MSSYDKVVKLACKPKAAPPKSKYLEPIIAATWADDGAVHDVCKALSPRFREPNSIIVFKALIVLHTMIRNGSTDNLLSHLSSNEVLRLSNVSAGGHWEGYNAPQNLQAYAVYLDTRIHAYRDLKHDVIRVQSESNRDMRNNAAMMEEDGYRPSGGRASNAPSRSKTVSGRKLRSMTVEKGLLRETKVVQKTIDTLVECRFYLDDLEDELTITALRMLVKDLLILFQAGNEGVINVLEHYFEMSYVDAESALSIYRHFCKQTEHVVEYLGVAKKLQNLLNVPIPNLKHAPVSLAGALKEYLSDPNFEQNRIEYKANKAAAEASERGGSTNGAVSKPNKTETATPSKPTSLPPSAAPAAPSSSTSSAAPKPDANKNMVDFFTAIEEEQPTMFNPQTGSPTANYFQQQAAHNPFVQRQMTGAFGSQPFAIQPQATGFMMPQQTAFPGPQQQSPNPFGLQPPQAQPQQHRPFSSFLQPQQTAFIPQQQTGFLQPQPTGSNPFRQSMAFPSSSSFSPQGSAAPFQLGGAQTGLGFGQQANPPSAPASAANFQSTPFAQPSSSRAADVPPRPASTPLKSTSSPPPMHAVKTHQTGSRNPFGVPVAPAPPVPKAPTLMEIAMGGGSSGGVNGTQEGAAQQPQQTGVNGFGGSGFGGGQQQGSVMAGVASSFLGDGKKDLATSPTTTAPSFMSTLSSSGGANPTPTGSTSFSDSVFTSLSTQPTGATSMSGASAPSALKPQTTGFTPLKAFKPTSSFGASLLESLPPIPQSSPTTPAVTGTPQSPVDQKVGTQPTGFGAFNAQATGSPSFGGSSAFGGSSSLGTGLRPQMTGGAANPFRASMFPNGGTGTPALPSAAGTPSFGGSQFSTNSTSSAPPTGGSQSNANPPGTSSPFSGALPSVTGGSPFGSNLFGSHPTFGPSAFSPGGQDPSKSPQPQHQHQHQPQNGSLI